MYSHHGMHYIDVTPNGSLDAYPKKSSRFRKIKKLQQNLKKKKTFIKLKK